MIVSYNTLSGLILVLIGAFIAFTTTSTLIDTDKKRIKFSNNFLGIIGIGQWIDLEVEMKIGLKNIHKGYRTYSRSNRTLDIHNKDIRIVLMGYLIMTRQLTNRILVYYNVLKQISNEKYFRIPYNWHFYVHF